MSKNIELNICTNSSTNTYETLYPKITSDNSVLPDSLITTLGLASNDTLTKALEKLNIISTSKSNCANGSFVPASPTTSKVILIFKPKLVILVNNATNPNFYIGVNWKTTMINLSSSGGTNSKVSITWNDDGFTLGFSDFDSYTYVAIG